MKLTESENLYCEVMQSLSNYQQNLIISRIKDMAEEAVNCGHIEISIKDIVADIIFSKPCI